MLLITKNHVLLKADCRHERREENQFITCQAYIASFKEDKMKYWKLKKNWVFIFCLLDIISFTITCFQKHLVYMYNFSDIIVEYHICMQVINILVK